MIKRSKLLASLMVTVLLFGSTMPAFASDIAMTGDSATGTTPTEFTIDENAIGGGLTVQIPASLELTVNEDGNYVVEDVVSAYGNMNPSKKLQVSTDTEITYVNADDNSITIGGIVGFGTDPETGANIGMEEWTAAQTKASIETLDSRAITVGVLGEDVQYIGTYTTNVTFDIEVVDANAGA